MIRVDRYGEGMQIKSSFRCRQIQKYEAYTDMLTIWMGKQTCPTKEELGDVLLDFDVECAGNSFPL